MNGACRPSHPPALLALLCVLLGSGPATAAETVYRTAEAFVAEAFADTPAERRHLWLDDALRSQAADILGHAPGGVRVPYWHSGERSAWILEAIGKSEPITVGIVVQAGQLQRLEILVYRETRGWEVRLPAFTQQFGGARLDAELQLDRSIDNISGATLSVNAVRRLVRLALMYHRQATA